MKKTTKQTRKQYWQKHINRYSKTSMSQKEYCRQNDIGYWSFNNWKRRLSEKTNDNDLVEIPAKKIRKISKAASSIELEINSSIKVIILPGFDSELLRNIISVLVVD